MRNTHRSSASSPQSSPFLASADPWWDLPCRRRYWGDCTGKHSSLSDLLGSLMDSDSDRLTSVLDTLEKVKPWKGTVSVRKSLPKCPSNLLDTTDFDDALNSPIFARLSTTFCSQEYDASVQSENPAPKLRWLMESISRNQSNRPDNDSLVDSSGYNDSPSHADLAAIVEGGGSGELTASGRRVNWPGSHTLHDAATESKPARGASTDAHLQKLLPPPTVSPTIAPRVPGGCSTPARPPALTYLRPTSKVPVKTSPRSGLSGRPRPYDCLLHRSASNVAPNLDFVFSLSPAPKAASDDGEAEAEVRTMLHTPT